MRRFIEVSLIFAVVLLCCHTSSAQVAKLYPVDEAAKDPSFFTFRARLIIAIQKHDAAFVTDILDPKITNSFGGDGGVAEFKETWKLNRPNSELWNELGTCLALGGKFSTDGSFSAPYVFAAFPEQFDSYEYAAIIGQDVRVRKEPSLKSPVIKMLSFDVVKFTATQEKNWALITLADNQAGYV